MFEKWQVWYTFNLLKLFRQKIFLSSFKVLMILELNIICLQNDRFDTHFSLSSCSDERLFFANVKNLKKKWIILVLKFLEQRWKKFVIFVLPKKTLKKKTVKHSIFFHPDWVNSRITHKRHRNNKTVVKTLGKKKKILYWYNFSINYQDILVEQIFFDRIMTQN